jgi:hypothetical protein
MGCVLAIALIMGTALTAGTPVGRAVASHIGHGAKKAALVISRPVRHPKKDAAAVGHWLKGDR